MPALNKSQLRAGSRQLNLTVSAQVHEGLRRRAEAARMSTTAYATLLFEAAYAARCGVSDDPDLETTVSATLLLHGDGWNAGEIAQALKVEPRIVERIRKAWESGQARRLAA